MANDQDVMMNGFPEANDGKYFYLESEDGKQIRVTDASAARMISAAIKNDPNLLANVNFGAKTSSELASVVAGNYPFLKRDLHSRVRLVKNQVYKINEDNFSGMKYQSTYILSVLGISSNTDISATYILGNMSPYNKDITTLQSFNYMNTSEFVLRSAASGASGFEFEITRLDMVSNIEIDFGLFLLSGFY